MSRSQSLSAKGIEEEIFRVKPDGLKRRTGFTIDVGGSLTKIAYALDKKDYIEFHVMAFLSDNYKDPLDYIMNNCQSCFTEGQVVWTTGIGAHHFKEALTKRFKIKFEVRSEMECCCNGIKFLTDHLPMNEAVYPLSDKAIQYGRAIAEQWAAAGSLASSLPDGDKTYKKALSFIKSVCDKLEVHSDEKFDPKVYPSLVVMYGSGALFLHYDGKDFNISNDASRAGTLFIAQGGLLTGETTFKGLVDLAERGDPENVSMTGKYLSTGGGIYAYAPKDFMVFSFGHAKGKKLEDFSKEDLSAAHLDNMAQDIAQMCHLNAIAANVDHIFICGSLPGQSEIVRFYIGKHLARYCMMKPMLDGRPITFHFLRYGGYTTSIGCLERNLNE